MSRRAPEEKQQEWKENILKQRRSGLSITSWCRQNGITEHTFYYWQNKFFPKTPLNRFAFTEINEGSEKLNTGVVVEYQGFNIYLSPDFDPSVLKKCLEALKKC